MNGAQKKAPGGAHFLFKAEVARGRDAGDRFNSVL
jgi:hypothetical protein